MPSPSTALRNRVAEVVNGALTELPNVENDKLPRQAGADGRDRLAVTPEDEQQLFNRAIELVVTVRLQVYLAYTAEPDETIAVDPERIEDIGDRLRRAFEGESAGTEENLWFLHLRRIEYPDDPTGNKTRLEAEIQSRASNPAAFGP